MFKHGGTLFPELGQLDVQARTWGTMLECLGELTRHTGLQLAGCELGAPTNGEEPSFMSLMRALAQAGPELDAEAPPAPFDLHTVAERDLHRAAATAYAELPEPEARFAHRQWRVLVRMLAAIRASNPHLRGEVYAHAALRAFAEYRLGDGPPLQESDRQTAEAIALVLRYTHGFFRTSHPGLGEAAYTLAPLALVERLRGMFPGRAGEKNPFDPDATLPPFPGGANPAIH